MSRVPCDGCLDIIDHVTDIDGRFRHFLLPSLSRRVLPEGVAVVRHRPFYHLKSVAEWKNGNHFAEGSMLEALQRPKSFGVMPAVGGEHLD